MSRMTPTAAELKLLTRLLIHGASYCRTTGPIARRCAQAGWVAQAGFDVYRITPAGERALDQALPAVVELWQQCKAMERAYLDAMEKQLP
jgi:hypothetical protein